jgi:serine/threonine protein kinase
VILYEMANLRHPFEADNEEELIPRVLDEPFDPVEDRVSLDLKLLIGWLLIKDRDERPTIDEIVNSPEF